MADRRLLPGAYRRERARDRSAGFLCAAFALILALRSVRNGWNALALLEAALSCAVLIFSIRSPGYFNWLSRILNFLGNRLARLLTPVWMLLLFLLVITPTALLARCFGKSFLSTGLLDEGSSYWLDCQPTDGSGYLKQY